MSQVPYEVEFLQGYEVDDTEYSLFPVHSNCIRLSYYYCTIGVVYFISRNKNFFDLYRIIHRRRGIINAIGRKIHRFHGNDVYDCGCSRVYMIQNSKMQKRIIEKDVK